MINWTYWQQLEEKYKYISSLVRNQTSQQISPKTREDLEKAGDSWKVGDARSLGDLLDGIISDARKMGPKFQNIKQSIRYLEEDLLKRKLLRELNQGLGVSDLPFYQ